jgi:hypothetical protein
MEPSCADREADNVSTVGGRYFERYFDTLIQSLFGIPTLETNTKLFLLPTLPAAA